MFSSTIGRVLLAVTAVAVLAWWFWDDLTGHWQVSTVEGYTVTCTWSADPTKTKTVALNAFAAAWLDPGDPCLNHTK